MLVGYIVYFFVLFWIVFLAGLLGGWLAAIVMQRKLVALRGMDIPRAGFGGIVGVILFLVVGSLLESMSGSLPLANSTLRSLFSALITTMLLLTPVWGGMVAVWLAHRNDVASKQI